MSELRSGIFVQHTTVPCGGLVTGTANWSGNDRGQEVAAVLIIRTEGRGDSDTQLVAESRLGRAPGGEANFSLAIPIAGPVTYHGSLLRVLWHVALVAPPRRTPPRPDRGQAEVALSVVPWGWSPAAR